MPPVEKATFSVTEVAELYSVTEATVSAWIRSRELRAVNVSRSAKSKKPRWRITRAALDAFEAARAPTPPTTHVRRLKRQSSDVVQFYKS